MNTSPNPEVAVLSAALELRPEERAAYLEKACAGDVDLRRRVEGLLQAHEQAGDFLETPAPGLDTAQSPRTSVPLAEKPGDKIGHYKLLQQIGEGGCGVVYMAEQEEPVRRRVALKVIKLGMDTKSVIARFEAERQALALMDHPNIARVFDAGATATGRPYFVMELVRGIKITDFCDENKVPTEERLKLLIQVCQAIQHAHQKGIIHRDIKPSNILLTINDGVAVPKVIDFGIAKATQGRLTDQTLFTAFEQFLGTPAYMSPEQAVMTSLDIDTRSDIYSLGVLLYELLTGKTPFEQKELLASGLDEMRRTIREKEPLKPSTRLNALVQDELTTTASRRHTEPPKLIHTVQGDLDWIVMKCLAKDRRRRYETANGLAMDLERHLKNEPVVARPPSKVYRFQRLVRRNKAAFAAATAVLVALLIGLGVSTGMYLRARTEARKSRQVAGLLLDSLKSVSPDEAKGRDASVVILERVADRVGKDLNDQPAVAAQVRGLVGAIYYDLGYYALAKDQQTNALALDEQVFGRESTNTAAALRDLGTTLWDQQNLAEAEQTFRQALTLQQKLFGPQSRQAALTLENLSLLLWTRGDLAEARTLIAQALAIRQKILTQQDPELRGGLSSLGLVLWEQGNLAEAEAHLRAAEDLSRKAPVPIIDVEGSILNNLANVLLSEGKLDEARERYQFSLDKAKGLPPEHPHMRLVLSHLAVVLRRQAALTNDPALLIQALEMNPADPLTADALACELAGPSLTPLAATETDPSPTSRSHVWRYTWTSPGSNWAAPDFLDTTWPSAPDLSGFSTYSPRTDRAVTSRTNFWLRREFELSDMPIGKLVLRLNRCQDAEVFLNGVQAAPAADWTDTEVLVPFSQAGQAALRRGRNVLAVHCQDADGGALVGADLCASQDPSLGREQLIDQLTQRLRKEPNRRDLRVGRANAYARQGWWTNATADFEVASDNNAAGGSYWHQLAPLLLETGRKLDYERGRAQSLDSGSLPDSPALAAQLCTLALLTPETDEELKTVVKLARDIAAPGNAKATLAFRQMSKGLVEFRRGQFAEAIKWMQTALETGARQDFPGWSYERERNRAVAAFAVEAMAYHQLRPTAEAQTALAKATDLMRNHCPQPASGDLGREWPDWLIAHILLREAAALVEGK